MGRGRPKKEEAQAPAKGKKAVKETKAKKTKKEVLEYDEEFIQSITDKMNELLGEFEESLKTAAAAKRARKVTNELAKMFKAFRSASVAYFKKD